MRSRGCPHGLVAALLAAILAGASATGTARADTLISFRTPSGNIGCVYSSGFGSPSNLRCDIRSRLRPLPPKPPRCDLDWGDSYVMNARGRVLITCHGDTAIDPSARVLRYGARWSHGGIVCSSQTAGLRCRNRSGHGFFLSRQHSYRF